MNILNILQVISGILLIIFILAQQRGSGLGSMAGGGGGEVFSSRRGVEKIIFNITIALVVFFVGVSVVNYLI